MGNVRTHLQDEVLEDFVVYGELASELVIPVVHEDAVVPEVVGTGYELGLVVGTAHLYGRVIGNRQFAQDEIFPAGVGGPGGLQFLNGRIIDTVGIHGAHVLRDKTGVNLRLVLGDGHEDGIVPQVELGRHLREGGLLADADAGLSGSGFVGRDEDDAVGAAGSVDGRRGGILQDFHGHDVLRIDLGEIAGIAEGETVHDQERRIGAVHGGITPDPDRGGCARFLGVVGHLDAGHASLHEGLDGMGRLDNELFGVEGRHGACQVALLHAAITDGYGFFQHEGGLVEDNVHDRPAVDRKSSIFVAKTAHRECRIGSHAVNGPGAILATDRILVRTGDEYRSAGNRFAVLVADRSGYLGCRLGMGGACRKDQNRCDCKEKTCNSLFHVVDYWLVKKSSKLSRGQVATPTYRSAPP